MLVILMKQLTEEHSFCRYETQCLSVSVACQTDQFRLYVAMGIQQQGDNKVYAGTLRRNRAGDRQISDRGRAGRN